MKKSNVMVLVIAAIVSAFLLWLWYFLRFNLIDDPLDLVLSVIWWALIAFSAWYIRRLEIRRQERIRTCYVDPMAVFNPEAGVVQLSGCAAETIQGILERLEYGFDMQEDPAASAEGHRYAYVVRSKEFRAERDSEGNVEVKEWNGEVADPSRPDAEPVAFEGREQLAAILAA